MNVKVATSLVLFATLFFSIRPSRAYAAGSSPLVSEVAVDRPARLSAGNRFGHALAVGGRAGAPEWAVVAAPLSGQNAGSVWIFRVSRRIGAADPFRLDPPLDRTGSDTASFDGFGFSLALAREATVLAVGAPLHDEPNGGGNAGAVYLFEGQSFAQTARLIEPNPALDDQFGASVAITRDGSRLAVGAPGRGGKGAVFLYRRQGGGWALERELLDPGGVAGDQLGLSVAIDPQGSRILAGAPQILGSTVPGRGRAVAFGADGIARPLPGPGLPGDSFGFSVAIPSSGLLLVGAPGALARAGAVYAFAADRTSPTSQFENLAPGDPEMGFSLAADGDVVLVGARREGADRAGGAFLFRCAASSCSAIGPLASRVPGPGAELGRAVAIAGDLALAGAPLADPSGTADAGAAVAFDLGGVRAGRSRIDEVVPGKVGGFRATFEIANRADRPATGLGARIDLPARVSSPVVCQGAGSIGSFVPGRIELSRFDLAPHELRTFSICGRLAADARGEARTSLRAGALESDATPGDLESEASAEMVPEAKLVLGLDVPAEATPGLTLPRQVVLGVKNVGPSDLLDADLKASLTFASFDRLGWCNDQGSACLPTPGTPRDFALRRTLRVGQSLVLRGAGKVRSGATGRLSATLRVEPRKGENRNQESRQMRSIRLEPKASFAITFDPLPPDLQVIPGRGGQKVEYPFTVRNNGPSDVRAATVREVLEREQEGLSGCTENFQRLGRFVAGSQVRITVGCNVGPSAADTFGKIARLKASLEDVVPVAPGVQKDVFAFGPEVPLSPQADLAIDFDDGSPTTAIPGGHLGDLCFSVENQGPSDLPNTRVSVSTGCARGVADSCLRERKILCSSTVPCPTVGNANLQDLLFAAHSTGYCRLEGEVSPAGRGSFEATVTIAGQWPENGGASKTETRTVDLTPQADLEVAVTAPVFAQPDPNVSPPGPWRLTYEVKITNAGPSQANDLEIELFQPALLENVKWCAIESASDGQCPDADARPGDRHQELATLKVDETRTFLVTGNLVDPPTAGPLMLAATAISDDAAPKGRRAPSFQAVPLPSDLLPQPPGSPTAALVVEGTFQAGEMVKLRAFLDDPNLANGDSVAAKLTMTLPQDLEVCDPASCEQGTPVCSGQGLTVDGMVEGGKVTELKVYARVVAMPQEQSFAIHGVTNLADGSGAFDPANAQDTHCPGNSVAPSNTVFNLGVPSAGSCGAFPVGEFD